MAEFNFKLPEPSGVCGQVLVVGKDGRNFFIDESQLDESPQDTIIRLKRRIEKLENDLLEIADNEL